MNKTPTIDTKKITSLVAETALACYGVVAIANRRAELLGQSQKSKKGKAEEGIFVKKKADNTFALDVYLVLAQGIKITESLRECRKSIQAPIIFITTIQKSTHLMFSQFLMVIPV